MCVTQKLCIVCFLLSYKLSFSPTDAQTTIPTEHNNNVHIHDHDGYQITQKSTNEIYLEESRYFVSKIFEKYGGINGTITFDMFANLMHNLGLGRNFKSHEVKQHNSDDHKNHDIEHNKMNDYQYNENYSPDSNKDSHDYHQPTRDSSKDSHDHHQPTHDFSKDDHHQDSHDHNDKVNDYHYKQNDSHNSSKDGHDHYQPTHDSGGDSHDHHQPTHDSSKDDNHQDSHDHKNEDISEDHNGHDPSNGSTLDNNKDLDSDSDSEVTTKKPRKRKNKKKQKTKKKRKNRVSKRDLEVHRNHSHCFTVEELLESFHFETKDVILTEDFLYLCPALLYQIDTKSCYSNLFDSEDRHSVHQHDHQNKSNVILTSLQSFNSISAKVWGYSTIAVVVISLAGLLGVAVIPIMQRVFYNHLLQFLVALAVGALSGDALLHLLPHAISGGHSSGEDTEHEHDEDEKSSHLSATYKGLVALTGIFFFFLMERILTIMTDVRRKRKQSKRLQSKEPHKKCTVETQKAVGAKLSTHTDQDYQTCEEMVMIVHPNKALRNLADDSHDSLLHGNHHHSHSKNGDDDESTLSLSGSQHGHSHHHPADVKSQSVAAIAWMVILGDGIHNFSDGLAIGAAFASSITGGVSTSVAVLCHELPHEIGDFAVLIRAGMNIKQAVMYNCVSSILCFVGMLIGVALGNLNDASLWIFACVGGMFLYIAMVDMLPEMTSVETKHGENPYCHLVFQCAGMILGAGIMLIIAIYEPDLLSVLDKNM